MFRTFFTAVLFLSLLVSGCYAPRSLLPLSRKYWPEKATAILPITTATVRNYTTTDKEKISPEKAVLVTNAVLNSLASSTNNKLMSPAMLISALQNESALERITVCLHAPLDESRKVEELSEFSRQVEIENIVQINIKVEHSSVLSYGYGESKTDSWGEVKVNAELISLIPPQIIKRSTSEAEYWSKKGVVAAGGYGGVIGILPYAYGKTFGRAVDQAARKALSQLFKQDINQDGHFIAYASGVVRDKKTGLEWIAGPDKDTTWYEAKSWTENLSIDGGGWRIPTIRELKTLYQMGAGTRNMTPLLKTSGWCLWSGELFSSSLGTHRKTSAFSFSLFDCRENYSARDSSYNTRCLAVRSKK